MTARASLTMLLVLAVLGPGVAVAATPAPTQETPIRVGAKAISRGALEALTRQAQDIVISRDFARPAAAAALVGRARLELEAERRGVDVRGISDLYALDVRLAPVIGGRSPSVRQLVARFAAFESRWERQIRCTPYWSVVEPCAAPEPNTPVCLWLGASEVCGPYLPDDPPQEQFWSVYLDSELFLPGSDGDSFPLERALRARIKRIPGLRARLGDIVNEGSISVSALDEQAARIVAREAFLLLREFRPRHR